MYRLMGHLIRRLLPIRCQVRRTMGLHGDGL